MNEVLYFYVYFWCDFTDYFYRNTLVTGITDGYVDNTRYHENRHDSTIRFNIIVGIYCILLSQ